MLKISNSVKEAEKRGAAELERLLKRIPKIKLKTLKIGMMSKDPGFDIQVRIELDGIQHTLIAEVKTSGQPRYAREAILRLKAIAARSTPPAVPVFIAPFLSESTRDLCFQQGISYLDFEGNARMAFDSVYLEIASPHKPSTPRREHRSLFKGRSAKVLRVLLTSPDRSWKLTDLAQESCVSIGHVSNVQSSLLDREWAERNDSGLSLTAPRALLDAWSAAYERPLVAERRFYTTLHGSMLEEALGDLFRSVPKEAAHLAMASFSAAQWISPFGRTATQYFYADEDRVDLLRGSLRLSSPAKGENVVVWIPKDPDVYFGSAEQARGIRCTSALQTYLDLMQGGERGREAADHLRRTTLSWTL
jgi:hypothetical protein